MCSSQLRSLALILLALTGSHHFILLTNQQSVSISPEAAASPPAPSSQTPPSDITEPSMGNSPPVGKLPGSPPMGVIVGIVIGLVVVIVIVGLCTFFIWRKKRRGRQSTQPQPPKELSSRMANSNRTPLPVKNPQSQGGAQQHLLAPTVPSQQVQRTERKLSNQIIPQSQSRAQYSLAPTVPSEQQIRRPPSFPRVHSPKIFTYEELERATDGFSESNKLGRGGFGTVYKGVLPTDDGDNTNNNSNSNNNNKMVAIKKLNAGATQGIGEFLAEVEAISRVHHRHIVSLVGYFIDDQVEESHLERPMMLVYEFIPNNSLDFHLHGSKTIDWKTRMKIAIVSAKGLAYLHEGCKPKIIHRDIKPSNILLDGDFQPKIADFGLAQLLSDTETHVKKSRIIGTIGYLAPEYLEGGRISEKSDVFAFGVVLLELITGRKPRGSFTDGMVKWARPLLSEAMVNRNFEQLADTEFQNDYEVEEMFRMVSCAANCIRHSPKHRPLMSEVVDALEGKIVLDNGEEVMSTQVDNEFINTLWKRALSGVDVTEHIEPSGSSHRNN